MVNDTDDQQAKEATTPDKPAFSIRTLGPAAIGALGRLLPRLGLHLFLIALPLLTLSYPAFEIASRLLDFDAADTLEGTLVHIDIRDVRDPEKKSSLFGHQRHYDVALTLAGDKGQDYIAIVQKSWPSPGLRRKMEAQYPTGDLYTLYRMPDRQILMESEVARDTFAGLTALMGLLFAATLFYYMLRSRLASRMPAFLVPASAATTKSLLFGQLVALLVAALFVPVIGLAPVVVPPLLFLGAYGAMALILCLSMRLLVFEEPPAKTNDLPKNVAKA